MAQPTGGTSVFPDSNIPMHLFGGDHPNGAIAHRLVSDAVVAKRTLVTDAEVLQEMPYRHVAIRREDAIDSAFALMLRIVDEVLPIERFDGIAGMTRLS